MAKTGKGRPRWTFIAGAAGDFTYPQAKGYTLMLGANAELFPRLWFRSADRSNPKESFALTL
jgi:hypothetical protein